MADRIDFGPRLSEEEYQRRIVALHQGQAAMPSEEEEARLRRRELDLKVDYTLGCRFPAERREALWRVQCDLDRRRAQLAFRHVLRRLFHRLLAHDARELAEFSVAEFSTVLSPGELRSFLDLQGGAAPMLPVDREKP